MRAAARRGAICLQSAAGNCQSTGRRLFATPAGAHQAVEEADLAHFRELLGARDVLTDPGEVSQYSGDWLGRFGTASCPAVLLPRSAEGVSAVLHHCNQRRIAVVPQGGNTGLVGGSTPVDGREVVLSLRRMSKIANIDAASRVVHTEAGVTLQELDEALRGQGMCAPLDLAAKGSCCIGGNVSTNAGGIRFLRFGSLHQTVLGLRVVLASGEVLDLRNSLPKDNTGYDLKQLFIGAEGTLGVVTDVVLQAPVLGAATNVAMLGAADFPAVLRLVTTARRMLGEIVSALEFADRECVGCSLRSTGQADPLGDDAPEFYLLIETMGSCAEHDEAKLDAFLTHALESGDAVTGTVAQDVRQQQELWAVRENIAPSFRKEARHTLKYDVSVPIPKFYQLVEDTHAHLAGAGVGGFRVVGFGHIGDGNLHLNVLTDEDDKAALAALEPWLYEWLRSHGGSVSAEHGIGLMKRGALRYSKPPAAIRLMRQLKQVFDPNGILNPNKIIPPEQASPAAAHPQPRWL
eukprot:TRINITY_DN34729_c0_g1_i1.p1 TRINITY_DN34729_c0_g1~~TRINITY_DN34729_c0_g1_i1.p1  ORF type:complete len:543 (+),score=119.98 TRINITY_DN34729_c0_g1_i1:74-1630(+)